MLNWLRIDPLEEEVGMDISRHKGPAYEMDGEGSAKASAIQELSASRRNLMLDSSNASSGKGKSFKREPPPADAAEAKPEDKPAEPVEEMA